MVEAYRSGGGVSWDVFGPDMRESQGDVNRATFLRLLGSEWFPSIPDVHAALQAGGRVADVGSGHGCPRSRWPWPTREAPRSDGFDLRTGGRDRRARTRPSWACRTSRAFPRCRMRRWPKGRALRPRRRVRTHPRNDPPYLVEVLRTMRRLRGPDGTVVVMDERYRGDLRGDRRRRRALPLRLLYDGVPDRCDVVRRGLRQGTVMRPSTLRLYALEAGFSDMEASPIHHDGFRFYRLNGSSDELRGSRLLLVGGGGVPPTGEHRRHHPGHGVLVPEVGVQRRGQHLPPPTSPAQSAIAAVGREPTSSRIAALTRPRPAPRRPGLARSATAPTASLSVPKRIARACSLKASGD